ncbi:hypothetical protein Fcan01_11358 [Folsomia candida]|uniref:Arrestin-like N-terminal domain-containing protein n=1 Tax=Folsomia candida TaxID=158441 RepID=A0A226E8U4_FOLCA|nr:hypothetical protein Fcan01_11358 [Folsomia candida]
MFGAIGGVTACAAVYSGHPNSFPCSSLGGSGSGSTFEFISTEISLPNGRGQKAICGNLKLTQQIGYKLIKIDTKKLDNWHYYGIKKELHREELHPFILEQNPASFPFKIQLPEHNSQLPSSVECGRFRIEYFLVPYLRIAAILNLTEGRSPDFAFKIDFSDGLCDSKLQNLEGEEEIFFGTGRLGDDVDAVAPGTLSRILRSHSVSSLLSLWPPSYSRAVSRRGSLMSLETLPPHYEDLCSGGKDKGT